MLLAFGEFRYKIELIPFLAVRYEIYRFISNSCPVCSVFER